MGMPNARPNSEFLAYRDQQGNLLCLENSQTRRGGCYCENTEDGTTNSMLRRGRATQLTSDWVLEGCIGVLQVDGDEEAAPGKAVDAKVSCES